MENSALYTLHDTVLVKANCLMSELDPGSWPPNWLQGNARISNPNNNNKKKKHYKSIKHLPTIG